MSNITQLREYNNTVSRYIELLDREFVNLKIDPEKIDFPKIDTDVPMLVTQDYVVSLLSGFLGGIISSSDRISKYFNKIHQDASNVKSKTLFGKILYHTNDKIDQPIDKFIKRTGEQCGPRLHRLYYGHDILSSGPDNPFGVLISQYGIIRGVLQVLRHLTADLFSKAGLPLPGSSYFDNFHEGKNLFDFLTGQVAKGTGLKDVEAFGHLFAIRMQDILASGLTWAMLKAYIYYQTHKNNRLDDKICQSQLKLMGYTTCFFTNCIVGWFKTGGVPFINWPMLGMTIKEFIVFMRYNYADIKKLQDFTDQLVEKSIELENITFATGKDLTSHRTGWDYIMELECTEKNFQELTQVFTEGQ